MPIQPPFALSLSKCGDSALRLLAVLFAVVTFSAHALVEIPPLKSRVTDQTGTLSSGQVGRLEAQLAQLESDKGSQLAVLIVSTTEPETIEQYSIRVVDQWKLGREQQDDGVLLLIAKDDRKLRIEVGQGLEGAIPDAIAKRIIDDTITPHFKRGDFDGGVQAGVDSIAALIRGEQLPDTRSTDDGQGDYGWVGLFIFIMMGVGSVLSRWLGLLPTAGTSAGVGLIAGWVVAGSLSLGIFLAVVCALMTLPVGARGAGWSSGGFGGSGSSGGFGGGGFSGGGGGFSGGGASGGW